MPQGVITVSYIAATILFIIALGIGLGLEPDGRILSVELHRQREGIEDVLGQFVVTDALIAGLLAGGVEGGA